MRFLKSINNSYLNVKIEPSRLELTPRDIRRGSVFRYFVARSNHVKEQAFEVNERNFSFYSQNHTLVTESIRWLIRGPLDDREKIVYIDDRGEQTVMIPGVRTQNAGAIKLAAEKIPVLDRILTPLQYYIGK